MTAYYNEIDPFKAEVIREAIKARTIAPGDVDERSIADVQPGDLVGYRQCHFFGGGGFWSLALRQAGWPDQREVWTGSCPCPSFSAAGKGAGFDDPRHLWPAWARLIRERRPAVVFGEQVAAAIGHGWLDLVQADLEKEEYAVGKIVLGACSVGAPHIRQRLYFVGVSQDQRRQSGSARLDSEGKRVEQTECQPIKSAVRSEDAGIVANRNNRNAANAREPGSAGEAGLHPWSHPDRRGQSGIVEHPAQRGCGERGDAARPGNSGHINGAEFAGGLGDTGRKGLSDSEPEVFHGARRGQEGRTATEPSEAFGGVADALGGGRQQRETRAGECAETIESRKSHEQSGDLLDFGELADARCSENDECQGDCGSTEQGRNRTPDRIPSRVGSELCACGPGALNGFWRDADWIGCRDGRWRPVKPGSFPLVNGYPARVGLLRLAGDAICVPAARAFIEAYLETV